MGFSKTHWRPRATRFILSVLLVACIWLYTSKPAARLTVPASVTVPTIIDKVEPDAPIVASSSNSTLGFGQIYVVSQKESKRRHSLIQAANVTELQLNIPDQPTWTEYDIQDFRLPQDSTILKGSLLAWLGHIHALQK